MIAESTLVRERPWTCTSSRATSQYVADWGSKEDESWGEGKRSRECMGDTGQSSSVMLLSTLLLFL
jgi:hypothetical protein